MSRTLARDDLPTSFGNFKPAGHVMIGLPDLPALRALRNALLRAGWAPEQLIEFSPRETVDEMSALIDGASPVSGFGSEITMMRRYLEAARQGTRWLLVQAHGDDTLLALTTMARAYGARLAVRYGHLVVEDLI